MKVLLYDLETSPNLAYVWGAYDQNVLSFEKEWELLSIAWKWLGEKNVRVQTREGQKTDKRLVKTLWGLLNEADVVVAHNGNNFDNKKAAARFIAHGLTPPAPYQSIDTLQIARKHFKFNSNRLDALGQYLGVGRKEKTGGFDLWLSCMQGDSQAWKRMAKYNKQDVALLERVYLQLRPWAPSTINREEGCPKCGSQRPLRFRGYRYTATGKFKRFQCRDCGGWSRARIAEKEGRPSRVAL